MLGDHGLHEECALCEFDQPAQALRAMRARWQAGFRLEREQPAEAICSIKGVPSGCPLRTWIYGARGELGHVAQCRGKRSHRFRARAFGP
jgi:hypothetical protein